MRRSRDTDRDGQLAAELLDSDKDQEEHVYAVESVAAALATHCTDLNVPERPFILRLANVQHLATDVTGELVDAAPALALVCPSAELPSIQDASSEVNHRAAH
jgi:menaquinone-specific isochorismate synthase